MVANHTMTSGRTAVTRTALLWTLLTVSASTSTGSGCESRAPHPDASATGSAATGGTSEGTESTASESGTSDSGTTTSTSTTSATDETSASGRMPSDLGPTTCDPLFQDCPRGEKCAPYSKYIPGQWDAVKCVPVQPVPDRVGEACVVLGGLYDGVDSCELGSICQYFSDESGWGVCVRLCDPYLAPECSLPNSVCVYEGGGLFARCRFLCNPLAENCWGDLRCESSGPGEEPYCTSTPSDGGEYAQHCVFQHDCAEGYACVSALDVPSCQSDSCCTPYCDTLKQEPCPEQPMQECKAWYEADPPIGTENLGYCGVP